MRRRRHDLGATGLLVAASLTTACGDEGLSGPSDGAGLTMAGDDYMDPPEPPIDCQEDPDEPECGTGGESAGAQGSPEGGPCDDTGQCADGICVAPFVDGEAGEPVCELACVANDDPARWCLDSAACCSASSVCTPRGFCVPADGGEETGSDGETGDDDDDDAGPGSTGGSGESGDPGAESGEGGASEGSGGASTSGTGS